MLDVWGIEIYQTYTTFEGFVTKVEREKKKAKSKVAWEELKHLLSMTKNKN